MTDSPTDQTNAAKRDAVLRRMLATPRPGKGGKKDGEPKPAASRDRRAGRKKPAPAR